MSVSADVTVTQAERVERLRAQLQGRVSLGARTAGKAAPAAATGLLYGVMLRAAARRAAGHELSDLETQMVEFFQPFASAEEIDELGRVFTEEQSVHALAMFPQVLNARGLEQGYAYTDLLEDLPGLRAEVAAEPYLNLVDLDRVEEGQPLDSAPFVQALADYGRGVTLVTASAHRPDARATSKPEQVAVELKAFSCKRASNELGSDEIYWALSANSDKNSRREGVTREYGSVNAGSYRNFDAGTYLFHGQVDKFMTAHIICWEADHSPDSWHSEMARTVRKISDILFLMADKLAEYGGHFPVPEYHDMIDYVELAGMIAMVIAGLIDLFTNHDDQVLERTFVFDRAAIGKWANDFNAITNWEFDGGSDGHHTLIAKATSALNARPRVTSMVNVMPGQPHVWSPDLALPNATMSGTPALAYYQDKLYCVVSGFAQSGSLWWSVLDGGTWRPFTQIAHVSSTSAPSLTAHRDAMWCAYTSGNDVRVISFNGRWSDSEIIGHSVAFGAPALGSLGIQSLCVIRGSQDKLFYSEFRRGAWGAFKPFPNGTTCDSPAVGNDNGSGLHCVVRGSNGKGLFLSSFRGPDTGWTPFQTLPLGSSSARPAIGAVARGMCLMYRADDLSEELRYATWDRTSWSPVTKHPTATSADGPALIGYVSPTPDAPYGHLYCVHRG
ncbi:hypothetical protein [Streptomyces sp. NPDC002287]